MIRDIALMAVDALLFMLCVDGMFNSFEATLKLYGATKIWLWNQLE